MNIFFLVFGIECGKLIAATMYVSAVMISAPAILVTGRTSTIEFPVNLCKFGKDISTVGRIVQLHLACVIHI